MAVVNTKATAITNADALPVDKTSPHLTHGRLREAVGTVEAAAGDSIGSTLRMARVPSWARISDIGLLNDALGLNVTGDIGLYRTAADGGAVVDADLFASLVDLNTARQGAPADVTTEATATNIDKIEKRLWELLGLTEDPKIMYDVVVTIAGAAVVSAGTVSLKVRYVDGT